MKHSDIKIGDDFWTMTGRWKCTDIGTRTIIAIKHQIDPRNMNGPPYSVVESVFDEYDLEGIFSSLRELADQLGEDDNVVKQLREVYGNDPKL